MFVYLLVISFSCVYCKTYRVSVNVPGGKVNEDISIDLQKQEMIVSVGKVTHLPTQGQYISTTNLHDYKTGMLGVKMIDEGECVIIPMEEKLFQTQELLFNMTWFHQQHYLNEPLEFTKVPISADKAREIAGDSIIDFCEGYRLFHGIKNLAKVRRSQAPAHKDKGRRCIICLWCSANVYSATSASEFHVQLEQAESAASGLLP